MKTLIPLLLLTIGVTRIDAQNGNSPSYLPVKKKEPEKANIELSTKGISPFTAFLLADLKMREQNINSGNWSDSMLIKKYRLLLKSNILYANAFLMVSENYEPLKLAKYGFLPGSRSGQLATGLIPIDKIIDLSGDEMIKYIQISEPINQKLNVARAATWVDWVQQGYQLPQSYFGNGVVVGIIDGGFDYTHPIFYDSTGTNYRVKKVWEQNSTGIPPSGYSYGKELATQTNILNAQRDVVNETHGTHVTGIAAGGGAGTNGRYKGVAPQSDIVLVSHNGSDAGVEDGINYIMNYATSVNRPCVINMSLGKHVGPHDGTSMFDQFCDGIVGQGKILVGAAGNEGLDNLYIGKSFTLSDTVLYSFVQFPNSTLQTNGATEIDIWGNQGQLFWVAINIYNTNTNQFEDYTPYIGSNSSGISNYTLYDQDIFQDACIIEIGAQINPFNNKPHIQVVIDNTDQDDNFRWVMIEIIAYNTQTKMWAALPYNGYETVFTANGRGYPWINGSTNSTVGEGGGTGNNIISVGAYNTSQTTVGDIASFSSKGPTADGRTKPDITAPGNRITSSVSRFDNKYLIGGALWNDVVTSVTDGANTWYFAKDQGTSMASPLVTGIMALWLEAYPNLTPAQAKTLIKDNARTDAYTGVIPANGNNIWGWGKIDAYEGLKDLLIKIPSKPVTSPSGNVSLCAGQSTTLSAPSGFSGYLWSNGATAQTITVFTTGTYSVKVTNSQGYISQWSNPVQLTINSLPITPSVNTTSNSICQGHSATLSVSNPCSGCNYSWSSGQAGQSIQAISSGSYSVTATNSCGSIASGSINIAIEPLPNTPLINLSPSNEFCQGESATLSVTNPCNGCTYSWSPGNQSGNSIQVTNSGNYTVTAANNCGQASSNVGIVVNPLPVIPTITTNENQLSSSALTGNQWYLNGSQIFGATQQTYLAQQTGNYYVVVTINNCSSQSNTISINVTEINEPFTSEISIYPIPTAGELNIVLHGNLEKFSLKFYDMVGRLVFSQVESNAQSQTLNLTTFPNGIYSIRIERGSQWINQKILVLK